MLEYPLNKFNETVQINLATYSINNKFLNIQYGSCGFMCIIPNTGYAIAANIGGSLTVGGTTVTANTFKGCYYGIRINNNVSLDCQLNSFTSVGSNPIFPGRCIYITNVNSLVHAIKTNTFKDFITGVEFNTYNKCNVDIISNDFKKFDLGTGVYSLQNINSNLNVVSNTFNNTAADFGNTAIRVQNAIISVNGAVKIESNDIRNCNIGIKNTNISNVLIDQVNLVKFVLSSTPTVPNYGIWNENCPYGTIYNNNVYKTSATAGSAFNNFLYGYAFHNGCSNSTITENIVTKMNTGFQFVGFNSLMTNGFGCNFINYNYTGLELNNTSIGNQGVAGTTAEDNQWQLPSTTSFPLTFGIKKIPATGATPIFNTRSLAYPWGLLAGDQNPPTSVTFTASAVGTTYGCIHGCLTPPFCPHSPVMLVKMATKQAPYDSLSSKDMDVTYAAAYKEIMVDSTLYTTGTPDDAVLINFKDSLSFTNIGQFYNVSDKVVLGDTVNAKIINDAVVPKDCMDQSQKIVNKIYISTWAKGEFEFTPADSAALLTIANYTVDECGLAVYDARVMLRIDKNDYAIQENRSMMQMPSATNDALGTMYPNPANTVAYYEIELDQNETGFVELFDLLGNMVTSQKLNSGQNRAQIDLTRLSNGLYVYKVFINGELKTSNKLIITK